MFCFFFVIWSSLFNMYVLEGILRGGEKKTSNWLFKTKWIFPFRSFPNSFYTQASAASAVFDSAAVCSLLQSSALLASGGRGRCSLCRSETLCQRAAGSTFSLHSGRGQTNVQGLSTFHFCFVFLYAAKLLLSVWTIKPAAAHRVRLLFFLLLQQLNAWWEVRGVTTTS